MLARAALAAVFLIAPLTAQAQEEAPPKPDPVAQARKVVEGYVERIKAQDHAGALDMWSFHALCEGIFAADYTALPEEEQAEVQAGLRELMGLGAKNPQVREAMAKATYGDLVVDEPDAQGRVLVTFDVTLNVPNSPGPRPQLMWIGKVGDAWKVVDMANGSAEAAVTRQLAMRYGMRPQKEQVGPLKYVRMMLMAAQGHGGGGGR